MSKLFFTTLILACGAALFAHPTSTFSGSHYDRNRPVFENLVNLGQGRSLVPLIVPVALVQTAAPGAAARADYLSRLLHEREITPWMMLVAIAAAFVLG